MDEGAKANCINDSFMNLESKTRALDGIENPLIGFLPANSTIYRFGNTRNKALVGSWWFGEEQHAQITEFAALHRLHFAHAARVLSAVLHSWSSDMTCLVKVRTKLGLRVYRGESLPQRARLGTQEAIGKVSAGTLGKPFFQMFIPGFHTIAIVEQAVRSKHFVKFMPEDSHIGGMILRPPGPKESMI